MTVSLILEGKGNNVITANPDTKVQDIASTLAEKKIGAVVICDSDGKVCGIASERDVVRQIASNGADSLANPISVCMTHDVVSCDPTDTINQVMEKMTKGRFRHVPIIKDGALAGIISIGDIVKARIEQIEREAEDMKQYIAG